VLGELGVRLLRPARMGRAPTAGSAAVQAGAAADRVGQRLLKGQLDLEQHGGRTAVGAAARVLRRILALAAVSWHNHKTSQPTPRSLVACHH